MAEAMNYVSGLVAFPGTDIVQQLYGEVGLRYARKQWRQFNAQVRSVPRATVKASATFGGVIMINEVEVKGFWFNDVWAAWIKDYLYRHLIEVISFRVTNYTRSVLLNVLQKSIDEGWVVDKTVYALEGLPLSSTQAARIVRTEVGRAANAGVLASAETFGYEQSKEWIAANDNRVRGTNPEDHASHRLLNGTVIDFEDYFIDPRNGDKMKAPGDPGEKGRVVHPESTINCRCMAAVVAKVDERGRLIPKTQKNDFMPIKADEIIDQFKKVKEEIAKSISLIPQPQPVNLAPVEVQLEMIKRRLSRLEGGQEDTAADVEIVKEQGKQMAAGMIETINESTQRSIETSLQKADELLKVIEGKNYQPEIKVDVNTDNVYSTIEAMRAELLLAVTALRAAIENIKPVTDWTMNVHRDGNELIKTITAHGSR